MKLNGSKMLATTLFFFIVLANPMDFLVLAAEEEEHKFLRAGDTAISMSNKDRGLLSWKKLKKRLWKSCTNDIFTDECGALCDIAPDICNDICGSLMDNGQMESFNKLEFCDICAIWRDKGQWESIVKSEFCECQEELGRYVNVDLGELAPGGVMSFQGNTTGLPIQDSAEICKRDITKPTLWLKVDHIADNVNKMLIISFNYIKRNPLHYNVHDCGGCRYAGIGLTAGLAFRLNTTGAQTFYIAVSGKDVEFTLTLTSSKRPNHI